jgi:hypothetical protein
VNLLFGRRFYSPFPAEPVNAARRRRKRDENLLHALAVHDALDVELHARVIVGADALVVAQHAAQVL